MILDWNDDRASHAERASAEYFFAGKIYDASGECISDKYRIRRADLNSGWIEHIPQGTFAKLAIQLPAPLKAVSADGKITVEGNLADADGINSNYMPMGLLMEYVNYRGQVDVKEMMPQYIRYGTTVHHTKPQWLLQATDIDKNEERTYAFSQITHLDLVTSDEYGPAIRLFGTALRSGQWKRVRAEHLRDHPQCEACASIKLLNVHHIEPFHVKPERELDPTNLITLCESPSQNHHLMLGHLGNWSSWNVDVRADAAAWLKKIQERPHFTQ